MQLVDVPRILIVDDDPTAREVASHAVRREGLMPVEAPSACRALALARSGGVAAAVLDLGLPDRDGFSLLTELAHTHRSLTMVVSADDREASRVAALRLGACDYVVKPASIAELGARLTAALRRAPPRLVAFADCVVDLDAHVVRRDGHQVALTRREHALLAHLATHPGQAFTRQHLLIAVWGSRSYTRETVTEHVRTLRQKLGPDAARCIVTVPGVGYRFDLST